ncbi:efflux RND transporter periplasmic adaptor subunit [Duganella sp. LX20W]|uniref:Efflux RND transporter periplasmic adaptor subunit n=2 Tax=Rugamonas brunnea TaxID=2758569 RepID=A0A7W2EVH6_9BURK|nr:efflux RND transporter periplasmic adaptor subunit [Rugamonas brunnea]
MALLARPAGVVFLASTVMLIAGCESPQPAPAVAPPPQVGIYTVQARPLALSTELPGRTAAFQLAEVRPQVSGIIRTRAFTEGADVKAGETLYLIDAASYQAAHGAAKATLERAEANLLTAAPKARRYKELLAVEGVSRQELEEAQAAEAQARADVAVAKAALESARINLAYTKVTAPIAGRIGRSNVTAGALVTAGQDSALATLQQLDPMYVDLTQSGEELMRLKKALQDGAMKKAAGQARVALKLPDGSTYAQEGRLQFVDARVDPGTGNVTLRAIFPNPKHDLMPGMFVRAVIENGMDEHAIVVPQQGVTRNPQGEATALVLNQKGIVEQRAIATSGTWKDQWIVKSGLNEGDRVIVEGLQKVQPGAPASVAPAKSAAAVKPNPAQ